MEHETLNLRSGYARTKADKEATRPYRRMTVEEAKTVHGRVPFLANDGTARELTINGKPKTWKRSPERVSVPVKYGMYEYNRLNEDGTGYVERLLVAL